MPRYIDADVMIGNVHIGDYLAVKVDGKILKEWIKAQPTVDVAPVIHSRWIAVNNPNFSPFDNSCEFIYLCNNCGNGNGMSKNSNYCPVCGAKMDEVSE